MLSMVGMKLDTREVQYTNAMSKAMACKVRIEQLVERKRNANASRQRVIDREIADEVNALQNYEATAEKLKINFQF